MTRELVGLEIDFSSVDVNNSYVICIKLRNKSKIPDADREKNLPPTQASNKTHYDETATPLNLH